MSNYWLGLVTLPALVVGGWIVAFITVRLVGLLSKPALGVAHRVRPAKSDQQRRALAAAAYSTEHGFVVALGEVFVIVGLGSDPEKRDFAYEKLKQRLKLRDLGMPDSTTDHDDERSER